MKPINFNESNTVYVADGCGDLPVYKDESQIASCWKLSFKERIKALLYGRIWLCVLGNNQHLYGWNVPRQFLRRR